MSPKLRFLTHISRKQHLEAFRKIMKAIKEVLFERVPKIPKEIPDALLVNRSRRRNQKRFCIALKRKMRAAQVTPALPYIKVELYMNQQKQVTAVRYYDHEQAGYAVCPNCGYAMEREYQKHCDQCGQLLGWKRFKRNEVTAQRITGQKTERENFFWIPRHRSKPCMRYDFDRFYNSKVSGVPEKEETEIG